jgi:hypothetical protein
MLDYACITQDLVQQLPEKKKKKKNLALNSVAQLHGTTPLVSSLFLNLSYLGIFYLFLFSFL